MPSTSIDRWHCLSCDKWVSVERGKEHVCYVPKPGVMTSMSHKNLQRLVQAAKLPTSAKERKGVPIATGFVDYFPKAIAAVAELSRVGNDQHNPGQPLHWERGKSMDHPDCLMRHFIERGTVDVDGVRHSAKVAWRALAILELEIEASAVGNTVDKKADHDTTKS